LSYYPKGFRSVATFRVDCDKSDQISFNNVLRHATEHSFPITWFIDVGAQEGYLSDIVSACNKGHDVQLHCYQHVTYKNYRDNKQNIMKGKDLLQANGLTITGFAAPFGKWNPCLNQVLEDLNFSFSSEFGIGYDDLPFYPIFNNSISHVLQVPVHPICMGSLRDVGFTPNEIITYFDRIIKYKYERNSPIMLYGHPKNEIERFLECTDFILSSIKSLPDIWITTYSEFAKWWQKRLNTVFSLTLENDSIHVVTNNTDSSLQLHIENPDGTEAYLPLESGNICLTEVLWSKKERPVSPPTQEIASSPAMMLKIRATKFNTFYNDLKQWLR
jgi:hypothetical protein